MSDEAIRELAADYVLGVLTPEEMTACAARMESDAALRDAVEAYEAMLAPVLLSAPQLPPPAGVWPGISAVLHSRQTRIAANDTDEDPKLNRWRWAAALFGALSAALAAQLIRQAVVEAEKAPTYVAVVNPGGNDPGMIIRIDADGKRASVRTIALDTPAGRTLQLWLIAGDNAPVSVAVLSGRDAQQLLLPPLAQQAGVLGAATFAISVEPQGGSPTGQPTGPVVYAGKLRLEQG